MGLGKAWLLHKLYIIARDLDIMSLEYYDG